MNTQEIKNTSTNPTNSTNSQYNTANITYDPRFINFVQQFMQQNKKLNELQIKEEKKISPTVPTQSVQQPIQTIPLRVKPPILDEEYITTPKQHLPVEPIRDKRDIERAKAYFHDTPSRYKGLNMRNYAMFVLGINTARRAGDIGRIQIKDILNPDGTFLNHLIIAHEEKTKKRAVILLHPNVKEALVEYLNTLPEYSMSDYLFANYKTKTPLTTNAIWKVIKKMQIALDLDINLGSHSMRKTFAYQAATNNPNDSATEIKTSKFLNHSNVEDTHIYMNAGQDEMDEYVMKNGL